MSDCLRSTFDAIRGMVKVWSKEWELVSRSVEPE
jgi:hypothetical protein